MKPNQDMSREFGTPPHCTGEDRMEGSVLPGWTLLARSHTLGGSRQLQCELPVLLRLLSVYQPSRSKVCRHWVEQQ